VAELNGGAEDASRGVILEHLPDGIAVVDPAGVVLWANDRFADWCGCGRPLGQQLFAVLAASGTAAGDLDAFTAAVAAGRPGSVTVRSLSAGGSLGSSAGGSLGPSAGGGRGESVRYFDMQSSAAFGDDESRVVVAVRDVTHTILEQQKRAAIHAAGQTLADLSPAELADMTVAERIELLKSNILHYSKDLLQFDVVEIRLLDPQTGRLEPLLAEGMQPEAEVRILHARPENNGVTGYVAATGLSYFCSDTTKDPLYLEGFKGAKSSLTVPLMLHDQVIGTFNVESPEPGGFSHTDLQFLEIFSRDVAAALNTLELLVAEKASTAAESIEAIHGAVALPVDDILNDAVSVMEKYIGHDADVVERLQRILRNARDIKQVIQRVGEQMAPSSAHVQKRQGDRRRSLVGRRILVVDADEQVRAAAHALLERCGATVETARDGAEAVLMVRADSVKRDSVKRDSVKGDAGEDYDVIISDIRLPDISGYQLLLRLQELLAHVPLVLMTGFGYDPGHSIVKARQAGIDLVLFKPFRVDQLLDTVEKAVTRHQAAVAAASETARL